MTKPGSALRAAIVAVVLCVCLPSVGWAATAQPTASPTPSKLDQDKAKLREQQAKDKAFNDLLHQSDGLRQAADQALAKINGELYEATVRMEAAQRDADDAARKLAIVQKELTAARVELGASKVQLAGRVAHLYIVGPTGYLPFMLGAADINDAMMAEKYGKTVLKADSDAVTRFRAAEHRVAVKEAESRALKHRMDAQLAAAQMEQQALQDLRNRQSYLRSSLYTNIQDKVADLARLARSGNPFAVVLAAFSSTGNSFTKIIQDAQEGQSDPVYSEHWLAKPVPGDVTQGFGWRKHPVYGYLSFHTGVDLAASYGDPIHPAQGGKVIDVGYFGPYGMTVLVDHGGSIATVYAHMSEVDVSPGDLVSRRTVLGKVGSTGWATGPHVHFEVRLSGVPQDPMRWF